MNKKVYILNGEPIEKTKTFCPNPVALNGIPDYANSKLYPKVKGTPAWRDWWDEQIRRCIQGYWTGGLWIPGRYYFFLNFSWIQTTGKGFHQPMFVDYQYEFFLLIEHAKKEHKGIISLKARRKGLSEQVVNGVFDHGMRFRSSYKAGIVAGQEIHADGFYSKYQSSEGMMPPEIQMNYLTTSQKSTVAGYQEKTETGFVEKGSLSEIMVRTMFRSDNVFKGELLDDCVFEEGGEFELLIAGYGSTEPCFMVGDDMVGTPFVYGTGGNMSKGSAGFSEMWAEPDSFNLLKFWVPATKMYFPCVAGYSDGRGNLREDIPYLKKQFNRPHQRVGMQDEQRAEERIIKKREEYGKLKNKKKYYDHLQNYPLTPREAFLSFSNNDYDTDLLSKARMRIIESSSEFRTMILDFKKDAQDNIIIPLEVVARLAQTDPTKPHYDHPDNYVFIRYEPNMNYTNLDLGGIDGYNVDHSKTSKSTGSMTVYRQRPMDNSLEGNIPICLHNARPKTKEQFFNTCLKIAVYYNLVRRVMIDIGSPAVIDYFKDNGGVKFLAKRPKAFESEKTTQQHDYGIRFTKHNLPILEGVMQSEIANNADRWPFIQHVNDCIGYHSGELENDADNHDSLMCCLALRQDLKRIPQNMSTEMEENPYDLPEEYIGADGYIKIKDNNWEDIDEEEAYKNLHDYAKGMDI
jgi:hypothetical protein